MIQSGNLVDLEMLEVAEKDQVPAASTQRAPSAMPRVEPPVGVTTPSEPSTLEPGEATPPEELTLVPRQRPQPPPGFSLSWADESDSPPPEQADWPMSIPQGLTVSMRSIQVIISHFPVMGEVHCEYQSQTIALTSLTWAPLQLAWLEPLDQPDSEEFWVNVMLFT